MEKAPRLRALSAAGPSVIQPLIPHFPNTHQVGTFQLKTIRGALGWLC